jgi:nucleoside 2-deoxyribosyltransferase
MIEKKKLYLASPLFSAAERKFNTEIKTYLSKYFDIFLPQESGCLFCDLVANGAGIREATDQIFKIDVEAIKNSEIILAVLDGRAIDEGVAFELGFAFALGKSCLALQTDPRRLLPIGNNPMVEGALSQTFESVDALIAWASANSRLPLHLVNPVLLLLNFVF